MLRHRPDVAERLRAAGALTAVFAHTETPCDLPYYPELRGRPFCPLLVGGLGGTAALPLTACPEGNLLHLPGDPFLRGVGATGENVCVHQLAHTILAAGLDETERARVLERYLAARQEGRWAGHLALLSPEEFFAEMSQSYFCANPEVADARHPQGMNCPGPLAAHDPATHALLATIYGPPADLR
jgi:hypothetical protein